MATSPSRRGLDRWHAVFDRAPLCHRDRIPLQYSICSARTGLPLLGTSRPNLLRESVRMGGRATHDQTSCPRLSCRNSFCRWDLWSNRSEASKGNIMWRWSFLQPLEERNVIPCHNYKRNSDESRELAGCKLLSLIAVRGETRGNDIWITSKHWRSQNK